MRDQGGSFAIVAATMAGAAMGPGTALVDEDVLRVLLLDSPSGEKAIQVRYDWIGAVAEEEGSVVVTGRDGRGLVVSTPDAPLFRSRLLAACRALPEVTRALRALGSRRGMRGVRRNPGDKEARFFAPLIDARRKSMEARTAADVIDAFDSGRLTRALNTSILAFAEGGAAGHPARRRALEAEIGDATERLLGALADLAALAAEAKRDVDDLSRWRVWAAGVQTVFEAADRAWIAIEPVVSR